MRHNEPGAQLGVQKGRLLNVFFYSMAGLPGETALHCGGPRAKHYSTVLTQGAQAPLFQTAASHTSAAAKTPAADLSLVVPKAARWCCHAFEAEGQGFETFGVEASSFFIWYYSF